MKRQTGFTLIELVIVILILGILSAVAAPRLFDLEGSARQAAAEGVAAAIASGASINFAARKAGATGAVSITGTDNGDVCDAATLGQLVTASTPISDYTIGDGSTAFANATFYCSLTDNADNTIVVDDIPILEAP
jgi:MSHA pilin protein MshA